MGKIERQSVWKAKGTFGYISSEKKRRALITAGLFVLPLLVLFGGIWYYGTRNNICTVLAIVGCLPGCRSIVNLIMICKCHPLDESLYREISAHQGDLDMGYEMYMTFYEKNAYIDAVAVCGNLSSRTPGIQRSMFALWKRISKRSSGKTDIKWMFTFLPISGVTQNGSIP